MTALADILAGFAAAGEGRDVSRLPWLLVSTACLYAGGVVFNDVFDAKLDAVERPERPIPSQRVPLRNAILLGSVLLISGVAAALAASPLSGAVAVAIALCALLYDAWGKHQSLFGPINMGVCRGLNLLLGISAASVLTPLHGILALIPVVYIAAITLLSRGEVHGGSAYISRWSLALLVLVLIVLPCLIGTTPTRLFALLPFLTLLGWRVLPPFLRACQTPSPDRIRAAVKAGVLSLIVLDATIAAGALGPLYGLAVLGLLLVAVRLARLFAVT